MTRSWPTRPLPQIFGDEYIAEKLETKAGWNFASPDEDWVRGYPQELEDFVESLLSGREPMSGLDLAQETVKAIYAAYLSAEKGMRVEIDYGRALSAVNLRSNDLNRGIEMEILGSPVKIGDRIAPNRIVNQPMECNDADEAGNPTEKTFARYRRLAEGGAGVIIVEALTISQESRARKNQLGIYEQTAGTLERLLKEMREINRESIILLQITHSGQQSGAGFSRLVSVYPLPGKQSHVLSEEEIEKIGDDFAAAALIARQVGADGIDFKQCHGYLVRRDDQAGKHPDRPVRGLL